MNKGGFSWKRLIGVTRIKQKISRTTGVPLTKSGRERKIGKMVTGGGCLVIIFFVFGLGLISVFAIKEAYSTNQNDCERRGCCSHNEGVCSCKKGRQVCCNGTLSPSCTC